MLNPHCSLTPSLNAAVVSVPVAGKDEELRPPGGVAATEEEGGVNWRLARVKVRDAPSLPHGYLLLQQSVTADWSKRGLRGVDRWTLCRLEQLFLGLSANANVWFNIKRTSQRKKTECTTFMMTMWLNSALKKFVFESWANLVVKIW